MTESRTITAAFESMAGKRSQDTAVIYLGSRYSYEKVKKLSDAFAAALIDKGFRAGQRAVIYVPNAIQWVVAWLGIQRAGGICVPITPIYTPSDLAYIANDSDAEAIVCADTNFGYVNRVLPETKIKLTVITRMAELLPVYKQLYGYLFDIVPRGKTALDDHTFEMGKLLAEYAGSVGRLPAAPQQGDALAEILYTGGTTKHPKGVPITHELFLISADEQIRVSEHLFPPEQNVIMANAPLFHILGQTCSLATLLVGGALILQPKVNLDATFESIQRFKAKTMIGVPTLYRMILEHDRLNQYDLSSVDYWYSAGDVLPVEVGNRWQELFGKTIYQGYGATETCGGVAMCPTNIENPPKSIGRIVPSKTVKVVEPTFLTEVEPGNPGELIVSSAHMVTRYINKSEETAASFIELEGRTW